MSDAREAAEWDRMAVLLAILANANRDPTKNAEPFSVYDFHPYALRPPLPTLDQLPHEE